MWSVKRYGIQVKHIDKNFSTFKALDDITLEFPTGKLVALLGLLAVAKPHSCALLPVWNKPIAAKSGWKV